MGDANVCFIGAGFHASTNIYPSAVEAGVKITAIATRHLENSQKALLQFGSTGTAYADYKEMLKTEDCDGVVVISQPKDQFSIALDCIRMGKNVFADKPLGWNEKEARTIAQAAKEHHVLVMVGFMKRFAPCYQKIKELIRSKDLGEPRSFVVDFAADSTPFCKNEEDFLKLAAIHMIDLLRFLFGEADAVSGFRNSKGGNISQCFSMKFKSGVVGSVYFSGMNAWSRESENLTVTFDDGFARTEEINKVVIHKSKKSQEPSFTSQTEEDRVFTPSATPMSGAYRDLYLRGFVGEMKHFVQCLHNGQSPSSNCEDNISTMILCDQILNSLK